MPTERFQFTGEGGHQLAASLDSPDGPVQTYALFAHCFTCGKDVLAAKRIAAALAAKGFTVLRDAHTRITARGEPMDFIGIRYWTWKVQDIARLARGTVPYSMLLAHTPKRLHEAQQLAIPAVLSGHTHGGQIVLPGVGAIAAREFPVIAGFERREGTSIFVSRGVGTVYVPVRINCPPEVAVLTLDAPSLG